VMLPYSCIDSLLYDTEFLVYYASQAQDGYGKITRAWTLDRTERGTVKSVTSNYTVSQQNVLRGDLKGHTEEDLRIDSNGNLFALTEILVTITNPAVYIETVGPRKGLTTMYEVHQSTPVVGPFGEVLHFDVILTRSIDQSTVGILE
jgi:hypothetical protein